MHFTEEQTALLKVWIIKKLEDISDADADVLADYALALVSTEDTEEVARINCVENLKDFLPNNAESFVDELFRAIATKSYDPNAPKPKLAPSVPHVPTGPKIDLLGPMNESRKRSFQWDKEESGSQNGHFQGGNRPIKQMRRGGKGNFERGGRQHHGATPPPFAPQQFSQPPQLPNLPPQSQTLPPLDPQMMMAMLNAMPGLANPGSPPNGMPFGPPGSRQRCRDYDTKGYCAAGASCPYDHGNDRFVFPPQNLEYDPTNAMLNMAPSTNGSFNTFNDRGRGGMRGRGRGMSNFRGGGKRSDFSMLGPNRDSTNTSIVVEQIPEDKLDEQAVRDFFGDFGSIEEVTMHADRKLAIVKYDSKAAAKAAYESPKVVFDNRFVKIYWYNSEKFGQQHSGPLPAAKAVRTEDVEMQDDEQQIDQAQLAKRQEEAQRKHDEAKKQREGAEKQKAGLDQKLKVMEAERKKMADLLAKRAGRVASPATGSPTQNGSQEESDQTKALRAQLAALEAEAKELGIDPDTPDPPPNGYDGFRSSPYRGRGTYRGRGRGRGFYQPYRGGWAGGTAARGGGVMRLDNRPKTISVTFANDSTYDANDEALRQFLLFNSMDTAAIMRHPEREDTALVEFRQRFEGENFLVAARQAIPHAGKVEAGWYSGPKGENSAAGMNGVNEFGDAKMEEETEPAIYVGGEGEEQDLDRFA